MRTIATEDRIVLEEFEETVMALSASLDYASSVSFDDPRSRNEFLKLFLGLRSCLEDEAHSYLHMVEVLKRLDTEDRYTSFLNNAEEAVSLTLKETSDYMIETVGKRIRDGEAFQLLESKFLMEVDGELVPRIGAEPSPSDKGYAAQVMYMSDTLGVNLFGPLCGIGMELTRVLGKK